MAVKITKLKFRLNFIYTHFMKSNFKKLLTTGLITLAIPLTVFSAKKIIDIRKGASGTPANIFIDTQNIQGSLPSSLWRNLSQGGEEATDMIKPVIPQIKVLKPELVRIDHIFDYYKVDQGNGNYDFSRLDGAVSSILATGARPMLSISYTPDSKQPSDWNQWSSLVRATAKHYSVDKNISGIYYEVWNEPDLFGGWHYAKDPNYSTLYIQTARAVADGAGSASYKIGGPAITAYYNNWIKSLFKTASSNNVRLDFISWHKYTKNTDEYEKDFNDLNQILSNYPQFFNIERLITEIGPNPEPDTWYDNSLSGIHLMSVSTKLAGKIHRMFVFEPVDGPSPRSDKSTGWGLITHSSNGLKIKPRYQAIQFLNQLQGQRVYTTGDGSWVSSISTKQSNTIQTLLVNYDQNQTHAETFPLTYQNLSPGKYTQTTTTFLGNTTTKLVEIAGTYRQSIYMEPNSAIIIELTPVK